MLPTLHAYYAPPPPSVQRSDFYVGGFTWETGHAITVFTFSKRGSGTTSLVDVSENRGKVVVTFDAWVFLGHVSRPMPFVGN